MAGLWTSSTTRGVVVAVAFLAGVLTLATVVGGAQGFVPYVSTPAIERTAPPPESEEAAEVYDRLLDEAACAAAFALSESGAYGWTGNHSDIRLAELIALRNCSAYATDCRIILRITPKDPVQVEGVTLSHTSAQALAEFRHKPAPKAVALSNQGDWGMVWGQMTQSAARDVALRNCKERLPKKNPAGWPDGVCKLMFVK